MASANFSSPLAIRLTRFFMRFAGFWIWDDRRGKIIMDLAMVYTIVAILVAWVITSSDLWCSRNNFYLAAYAGCNAMTVLIILIKLTWFTIQRGPFMKLIKFCYENFWERSYDAFGESVLRDCERQCVYFVSMFTFFAQCTVCSYMLHPLIENIGRNETDRILPFTIWLDFPMTTTPYYELMFSIETLALFHSGICYFCFDNLLCIMNVHAAGQFRILQRRFERWAGQFDPRSDSSRTVTIHADCKGFTGKESPDWRNSYAEFTDCVRKHHSLIRFTEMVEEVYTFVILGQFIVFSLLICLVSYQAVLADGPLPRRMIFIVHSAGTFTQLFMLTLTCDNLMQESQEVGEAAYRAHWYKNLSNPALENIGRDTMLVMMRARRPCCLTAGGFFPITLQTFRTILSTSMSYLTLLRQGQEASGV